MKLLSEEEIGFKDKKIFKLSWENFECFADVIVKDIMSNNLHLEEVCLLGTARGALPLLTYVSHQTGIRDISIMQLKMTDSDTPFDYGEVSVLLKSLRDEFTKFIVLEDIIYKGQTVGEIQKELKKENKKIVEIYSLVIDEGYDNKLITIPIKSVSIIEKEKWVIFPWENNEINYNNDLNL
ncbi:phosphoribosyltransferase [Halanaerobium congolense]|jgi:orotate phosphoribosyltransferase-like protein|uniref:phosphoribosyltransferase n=1 Tax=Halanaerobium congolense TaxID=54121 RepID=UPI00105E3E40|nr:phosphoribosyltransferase [Halanaerobium congolense]TDP26849.1 phosphoribosyl transferase-like protein [Halanaerobium congolense]